MNCYSTFCVIFIVSLGGSEFCFAMDPPQRHYHPKNVKEGSQQIFGNKSAVEFLAPSTGLGFFRRCPAEDDNDVNPKRTVQYADIGSVNVEGSNVNFGAGSSRYAIEFSEATEAQKFSRELENSRGSC